MIRSQTTMNSDIGQMTIWPTASKHPVNVEINGEERVIVIDAIIVDLPDEDHKAAEPAFLACGVVYLADGSYVRITGLVLPFMTLPLPLRDEIILELTRHAEG